ncbi:MAG: DNA polymerase III subunit gamma/tau [Eubacteriales bacterium]|nr:DNA polymerase III subunit gamma/tau [Eubacteriales bacterium]
MSYTALYRKFRPDTFADVKGQDAIVQTLKNQIKLERIGHAYLFCGTRGTGKTTIAKIMAKAVNCEHPVDGNPCNECASCRAIASGASMNVIEIDAASNNGVDNIREIREEVSYSPTEGRYKVYIIDEVHMLSAGAYNALLKTLEEPPSYVIFILATTEANRLPVTILSRCQRYDFKRISVATITERLQELLKIEKVEAEEKAVRYIAVKADGALRDALSLLDQCIAFYPGQKLTYEQTLDVLGAVDTQVFSAMLRRVLKRDVRGLMKEIEELVLQGRELGQFVTDFTWYLRNLLLLKTSDSMEDVLDISEENLKLLQEEAGLVREEALMRYIRILSELSNRMKFESSKRLALEVTLIKMCRPEMERDNTSLLERIRSLEKRLEEGIAIAVPSAESTATGNKTPGTAAALGPTENRTEETGRFGKAAPEDLQRAVAIWKSIVDETDGRFRTVLSTKAKPQYNPAEEGKLYVVFTDFLGETYLHDEEKRELLESIIASKTGKKIEVKMVLGADSAASGLQLEDVSIDEKLRQNIHNINIEIDDSEGDFI